MTANLSSPSVQPKFNAEKLRLIEDAREPLSACMATLRVWRVAVETSNGDVDLHTASQLQCALIVVNETLNAHKDALCEEPTTNWLVGCSLARMLEDALWNVATLESSAPIQEDDLIAVADLALHHLEAVARWLANPEAVQ